MNFNPPGSSVYWILQARIVELPFPPLENLPYPGMDPMSPASADRFFTAGPHGKPIKWSSCSQLGIFSRFTLDDLFNISPRDAQSTFLKWVSNVHLRSWIITFAPQRQSSLKRWTGECCVSEAPRWNTSTETRLPTLKTFQFTDGLHETPSEQGQRLSLLWQVPPQHLLRSNEQTRWPERTWFEAHAEENERFHVAESKLGVC